MVTQKSTWALALAVLGIMGGRAFAGPIETVTVHSGNGDLGVTQLDSLVHFLPGTTGSPETPSWGFTSLSASDFTSARTAPAAWRVNVPGPLADFWKDPLTADAAAQWVSQASPIGAGNQPSGLYAIPFEVPSAWSNVTLDFYWVGDNGLGGFNSADMTVLTEGLYLNGLPLHGTATPWMNNFSTNTNPELETADRHISLTEAGEPNLAVAPGTNWLYVNNTNLWGPGGVSFSFTFSGESAGTNAPEPASLGLVGLGALALLRRRR